MYGSCSDKKRVSLYLEEEAGGKRDVNEQRVGSAYIPSARHLPQPPFSRTFQPQ